MPANLDNVVDLFSFCLQFVIDLSGNRMLLFCKPGIRRQIAWLSIGSILFEFQLYTGTADILITLYVTTITIIIFSLYKYAFHKLPGPVYSRHRRTIDCSGFSSNRLHQSVLQPLDFTLLAQGHNAPNLVYCLCVYTCSIIG